MRCQLLFQTCDSNVLLVVLNHINNARYGEVSAIALEQQIYLTEWHIVAITTHQFLQLVEEYVGVIVTEQFLRIAVINILVVAVEQCHYLFV